MGRTELPRLLWPAFLPAGSWSSCGEGQFIGKKRMSNADARQTAIAAKRVLALLVDDQLGYIAATETYPTSNLNQAEFSPSRMLQSFHLKAPVPQAGRETRSPQTSR